MIPEILNGYDLNETSSLSWYLAQQMI